MADQTSRQRILDAIRALPRSCVAGYGHVAARAGLPGRARLVARVLATEDDPDLPWHRVLRSDGRIAFAHGSPSWQEQTQRLRAEGVDVVAGRVRMPARDAGASHDASMDALLWAPADE